MSNRTAYVTGIAKNEPPAKVTVVAEQADPTGGKPYITVEYAGIEYVVREVVEAPAE